MQLLVAFTNLQIQVIRPTPHHVAGAAPKNVQGRTHAQQTPAIKQCFGRILDPFECAIGPLTATRIGRLRTAVATGRLATRFQRVACLPVAPVHITHARGSSISTGDRHDATILPRLAR